MEKGIQFPFTDIYLKGPSLAFIGSRPGMGRTQYLLQLIKENCLEHNNSSKCLAYFPFQRKSIVEDRIKNLMEDQSDAIIADFKLIQSKDELSKSIIKQKIKYNAFFIVIDGIEKIVKPNITNSYFNDLIRDLYILTEDLSIPIICTTYLNSSLEERFGAMHPRLLDFNSEGIEIYSDVALALHRPYYYGYEEDENGNNVVNQACLFTLKNIAGPKARYDFLYNEENNLFYQ